MNITARCLLEHRRELVAVDAARVGLGQIKRGGEGTVD